MRDVIWSSRAIRLGFAEIKGLKEEHATILMARRGAGYASVRDLWLRTGLPVSALEVLAEADAFQSIGLNRRKALWAVRGLVGTDGAETLPLFKSSGMPAPRSEIDANLPLMKRSEDVVHDYRTMSFSLKAHPMQFLRPRNTRMGSGLRLLVWCWCGSGRGRRVASCSRPLRTRRALPMW
jgi:error-prone DNA polymerase